MKVESIHKNYYYYYYYYYLSVCEWHYNYIPAKKPILRYIMLQKKGKAVPVQVWTCPEGFRRLKLPDFKKPAHDGGKVVSHMHQPPLPPTKYS
jgi:hypothetical protein